VDRGGGAGVWEYDAVYLGREVGLEGRDGDWGGEVWEERYCIFFSSAHVFPNPDSISWTC
jgi:hypothetical protein